MKAVKQVQCEKPYTFRCKGNEEQSSFNDQVAEAQTTVEHVGGSALQLAKDALKKGAELITARQKLIRLADRSEYDWALVSEYEADDLASDSKDEKRMKKAKKSAERKGLR